VDPRTTPLFVIDVQNGFVNDRSRHVVPVITRLIEQWETAGAPVLFSRYLNHPGSPFVRLLDWSALQSSPETDIVPELAPYAARAERIVDKATYSALSPALAREFHGRGWEQVVLCGIATDSCVLKTAADAFEADLTPLVVTDACASEAGAAVHEAGLTVARRMIGARQLITAADTTALLAHAAEGTPA
jgi:nicotinamidase-related amidase